jgi:hypothetical protein
MRLILFSATFAATFLQLPMAPFTKHAGLGLMGFYNNMPGYSQRVMING